VLHPDKLQGLFLNRTHPFPGGDYARRQYNSTLLATIFVAFTALLIFIESRKDKARKQKRQEQAKQGLDAAAMRFALCYAVVEEIDRYTKNRIPKHVEQAIKYWNSFTRLLAVFFETGLPRLHVLGDGNEWEVQAFTDNNGTIVIGYPLFSEVSRLESSHSWFRLQPETQRIVSAFNGLERKIPGRLKDKKDLKPVAEALRNLAKYLYSVIPELSSEEGTGSHIQSLGQQALMRFADEIGRLSEYRAEQRPPAPKEKASRKLLAVFSWLVALFSRENLLVRFMVWWAFSQTITLAVLKIAVQFVPSLKLDSHSVCCGHPATCCCRSPGRSHREKITPWSLTRVNGRSSAMCPTLCDPHRPVNAQTSQRSLLLCHPESL